MAPWLTPDEQRRVVPLTIAHFLFLGSMYLLKPARNAFVLDRLGIGQLPYVLIAVALIGGLVSWLFSRHTRDVRLDRLAIVGADVDVNADCDTVAAQ